MAKKFSRYSFNGVGFTATAPRSSTRDDKKYMRWVKDGDGEVVVHWGQPGEDMERDVPDSLAGYNSRHSCGEKRDPTTPGFQACWHWNTTSESEEVVHFSEVVDGLPGGDFSGCVSEMRGEVDDPEGFCASRIHELTGKWPAEEAIEGATETHVTEAKITHTGRRWDVTIMGETPDTPIISIDGREYLKSMNGRMYDLDGLRESAHDGAWEGVQVFDNHLTDSEFTERAGMRSVIGEGLGVLTNPRWDERAKALRATLNVIDDNARSKLTNAAELDVLDHIGLSIDALTERGPDVRWRGETHKTARGFERILSLDLVAHPAAGGGFNRMIESQQTGGAMAEVTQEQMDALKAEIEGLKSGGGERGAEQEPEELAARLMAMEEEISKIMEMMAGMEGMYEDRDMESEDGEPEPGEPEPERETEAEDEPEPEPDPEREAVKESVDALKAQIDQMAWERTLERRLDAAQLAPSMRDVVSTAFEDAIGQEEKLDKAIERAKEAQAQGDVSGRVRGAGGRSAGRVVMTPQDRAMMGLMQLAWPRKSRDLEKHEDDRVLERVPESYKAWINAGRPNARPRTFSNWLWENTAEGEPFSSYWRWKEGVSLTAAIQDAVNVMLAQDYSARPQWWSPLVTEMEVDSAHDVNLVTLFGMADLPTVTEGAEYTAIDYNDKEEVGTYKKKGGFVGVSREDMLKDRVGAIQAIPRILADTWYKTHSSLAAATFTVNSDAGPTLSDTGALFNATAVTSTGGHANLLTAALSFTSYKAARYAMMKQADRSEATTERLLIRPRYALVPIDLESTALQIRNTEMLPGSANNDVNPYYQEFDVVVVPRWTDTNNWALMGDPQQYPSLYAIYLRGGRTPQIFSANNEQQGAMFTNDEMRWKIRMEIFTDGGSGEYDCLPVADFRPLHKNNVT